MGPSYWMAPIVLQAAVPTRCPIPGSHALIVVVFFFDRFSGLVWPLIFRREGMLHRTLFAAIVN